MSIVLSGSGGNITTPLRATVTALANNGSGKTRVTTSGPHLFGSNNAVYLNTTVLIGFFRITVIDSTHFDIGAAYSSNGTGTATDMGLTPSVQIPTDGDPLSAQLSGLLSAFQGVLDRTQYLQEQAVVTATPSPFFGSVNLHPQFSLATFNTLYASSWDFVNGKWLVAAQNTGTFYQGFSTGRDIDGAAWATGIVSGIGAGSGVTLQGIVRSTDLTTSPPGKHVYLGVTGGTSTIGTLFQLWQGDTSAGSWASLGLTSAGPSGNSMTVTSIGGWAIAGCGSSGSSGFGALITTSTALYAGASFSIVATPAGSVSGFLLKNRALGTLTDRVIAIPIVAGGSTGAITNYSTTSGSAFAGSTMTGVLGATEKPSALTYTTDLSGSGRWLLATWTGTQTNLYASADVTPLQWSAISNNVGLTGIQIADMASVNSMVVATESSGSAARVICSSDGGSTWSQCAAAVKTAAGSFHVSASQNQFLVNGPISIMPSLTYGASGIVGPT